MPLIYVTMPRCAFNHAKYFTITYLFWACDYFRLQMLPRGTAWALAFNAFFFHALLRVLIMYVHGYVSGNTSSHPQRHTSKACRAIREVLAARSNVKTRLWRNHRDLAANCQGGELCPLLCSNHFGFCVEKRSYEFGISFLTLQKMGISFLQKLVIFCVEICHGLQKRLPNDSIILSLSFQLA